MIIDLIERFLLKFDKKYPKRVEFNRLWALCQVQLYKGRCCEKRGDIVKAKRYYTKSKDYMDKIGDLS